MSHYRRETIESWVSDFAETDAFRDLAPAAREYAAQLLPQFLERACAARDVEPGDVEEADVKQALLEGVATLDLPASVHAAAPNLCAALLGELETQGRLAGGRALARFVRALRTAYEERTNPKPIRNPGPAVGRNDPCPCGSGKKFKKCCLRT